MALTKKRLAVRQMFVIIAMVGAMNDCGRHTSDRATRGNADSLPSLVQRTIRFGIAWGHGSADKAFAYFGAATFSPGSSIQAFTVNHWFQGTTTKGRAVKVMIDSVNPQPEYYEAALYVTFRGATLDSGEVALFWDTDDTVTVLPALSTALDPSSTERLKQHALALHQAALPEADVVPAHDIVEFAAPEVRRADAVPDVVTVYYKLIFKQRDSVVDDRADAFFLYSMPNSHVLFETFGHPEWGSNADKVVSVKPVAFFRVLRDPHVYVLAGREGAWESGGSWAIFDLRTGKPLLW